MEIGELRHYLHMQEVEKKLKLWQMNLFIKNYEQANENPDKTKPLQSAQMVKLINEIREMRDQIKEINTKVEEYHKELNSKGLEKQNNRNTQTQETCLEIDNSYMYPIPADVERQLYTGISSNKEGRYRYLRTRNEFAPDEKYRVCPTQNYKYGWNIKKQNLSTGLQKHGRKQVLKTAMYSIHGITLYEKHPTQRPPNAPGHLEVDAI